MIVIEEPVQIALFESRSNVYSSGRWSWEGNVPMFHRNMSFKENDVSTGRLKWNPALRNFLPFSPVDVERVAEGRMRGFHQNKTTHLTLRCARINHSP
jgi:hypothetical protein